MSTASLFGADHAAVFETWNRRGFADRCTLLANAIAQLPMSADHEEQTHLLPILLDRARHMGAVQELPGPTGESNELYLVGRGHTLVFGTEEATPVALSGQVICALACGNPVLLNGQAESDWCQRFVALLHLIGVPRGVLVFVENEDLETLLQLEQLALVAPVCRHEEEIVFQRQLAGREGLLVQLASECDPAGCSTLLQPDHIHRFVTEKTRTINTTAVGGNATLLELGSAEH